MWKTEDSGAWPARLRRRLQDSDCYFRGPMGFAGIGDWVALASVGARIRMGKAVNAVRGWNSNHLTPPSFPKSSSVANDADRTGAFCWSGKGTTRAGDQKRLFASKKNYLSPVCCLFVQPLLVSRDS
jgi:hypothetical protein